ALELEALSEVMTLLRGAAVLADRDHVGVRGPDREVPRRDVLGVVAELQLIGVEGTYWVCDRLRSQTDQHEGSDGRCGDRQRSEGEDARGGQQGSPHREPARPGHSA